jgi:hypothetical protein
MCSGYSGGQQWVIPTERDEHVFKDGIRRRTHDDALDRSVGCIRFRCYLARPADPVSKQLPILLVPKVQPLWFMQVRQHPLLGFKPRLYPATSISNVSCPVHLH